MRSDQAHVQDVLLALAKEQRDRSDVFSALLRAGHVSVMEDNNPALIRVRIEDEYFEEERSRFPSTGLMARLQLAIAAGRTDRDHIHTNELDAANYWSRQGAVIQELRSSSMWWDEPSFAFNTGGDILHGVPHGDKKKVTAAVSIKTRMRGLRP